MIIRGNTSDIAVINGGGAVSEFKMKATAKAFGILSSGLYTNKIRAIIRELSCNAYDSHVTAGHPERPFDVHLPTIIEPWFSVRDYGTGMSEEDIMTVYTTYFESTKTESNDTIGGLGLGSKAPFSYTDNFSITSYYNGKGTIYSAFLSENGLPAIVQLSSFDSNEPSGMEIKIGINTASVAAQVNELGPHEQDVASADINTFLNEAQYVYHFFNVKPNFSGNTDGLDPNMDSKIKYIMRDIIPGVHLIREKRDHGVTLYPHGSVAVMGQVAYPLSNIPVKMVNKEILNFLNTGTYVFNFEVGELDIQASRENLSFDRNTIETVSKKIMETQNSVVSTYLTKIASLKSDPVEQAITLYTGYYGNATLQNLITRKDVIKVAGNNPYVINQRFHHSTYNDVFSPHVCSIGLSNKKLKEMKIDAGWYCSYIDCSYSNHTHVIEFAKRESGSPSSGNYFYAKTGIKETNNQQGEYGLTNNICGSLLARDLSTSLKDGKIELTPETVEKFDSLTEVRNGYATAPIGCPIIIVRDISMVETNRRIKHLCNLLHYQINIQDGKLKDKHRIYVSVLSSTEEKGAVDVDTIAKSLRMKKEHIILASALPKAPVVFKEKKAKAESVKKKHVQIYEFEKDATRDRSTYVELAQDEIEDILEGENGEQIVYMVRRSKYMREYENPKNTYTALYSFSREINTFSQEKYGKPARLVAVMEKDVETFLNYESMADAVSINEFVSHLIDSFSEKTTIPFIWHLVSPQRVPSSVHKSRMTSTIRHWRAIYDRITDPTYGAGNEVDSSSPFMAARSELMIDFGSSMNSNENNAFMALARYYDGKLFDEKINDAMKYVNKVNELVSNLVDRYPMLLDNDFDFPYGERTLVKRCIDYIKMVDASNAVTTQLIERKENE